MQNFTRNWYAVYTKPKSEKKVLQQLAKKRIDSYCPLNRSQRDMSDRKRTVVEPLFNSYVFVYLHEGELAEIFEIDGVINFVHWLGKPAVIRDEDIAAIRKFLHDFSDVRTEKNFVNLKDHVRVISGPVMTREGNILEVRTGSVKVNLPSLGHTLIAEVQRESIEQINPLRGLNFFGKLKASLIP